MIMKKNTKKLTNSEQQVLDLLWDSGEELTSSQIVQLCEGRTWKESYIHILINSLLKKDMIKISGFRKTTKNYARTFVPTMTRDEYSLYQYRQNQKSSSNALSNLFCALLEEETDSEVIDDLLKKLEEKKATLQ
jgi:predicted transcriptional regulator